MGIGTGTSLESPTTPQPLTDITFAQSLLQTGTINSSMTATSGVTLTAAQTPGGIQSAAGAGVGQPPAGNPAMSPAPGGFAMQDPPPVTGFLNLRVDYRYFGTTPEMIFNGAGRADNGIVNYDSGVPFILEGHVSGPAILRLTFPDGSVSPVEINGPFGFQMPVSIYGFAINQQMQMKAELLSKATGQQISQAIAEEKVAGVEFKFAEVLSPLGEKADAKISDIVQSKAGQVFGPRLADDFLTEMANQRLGSDPTGPGIAELKETIRGEIIGFRTEFTTEFERIGRTAITQAIDGDGLTHSFRFGGTNPSGADFAADMAAYKSAIANTHDSGNVLDFVKLQFGGVDQNALIDFVKAPNGRHFGDIYKSIAVDATINANIIANEKLIATISSAVNGVSVDSVRQGRIGVKTEAAVRFINPLGDRVGKRLRRAISGYYEHKPNTDPAGTPNDQKGFSDEIGLRALLEQ